MSLKLPVRIAQLLSLLAVAGSAHAQMMRPPSFIGGVPAWPSSRP